MHLCLSSAVSAASSLMRTGPSSTSPFRRLRFTATASAALLLLGVGVPAAQAATALNPPLPDLTGIVKNKTLAIVLGKALFWDEQAGSDGIACASCHFQAGADTRITNQLSPGPLDITKGQGGDVRFGSEHSDTAAVLPGEMPSQATAGPNYTLKPADMPLHQLADETNRNSPIVTTTNDRISSQGAYEAIFTKVPGRSGREQCRGAADLFHVNGLAVRQDEPRNTPTVINAVFNHRNFWDGRANNTFNGVGVFGMRDILGDPAKRLVVLNGDGSLKLDFLQLANASLASQAVGPPLSTLEMSCANRTFADIGRRLLALALKPLKNQRVDRNDSVLGPFAHPAGKGLKNEHGYEALIRQAFDEKYWAARGTYRITSQGRLEQVSPGNGVGRGGYTQTELNFPMFWGIAIMLYEATLISNQSDYDDRLNSGRLTPLDSPPFGCTGTMGDAVDRGCALFFSPRNGCLFCHGGKDLFSAAAFQQGEPFPTVGRFGPHTHDSGFFNVGVRPVFSDLVNGGIDPYGNPLSFTRQLKTGNKIDPNLDGVNFPGGTTGVDGTSKAPSMRNVALTPPYFADGSHASLRQVLKFYNRGGNRRDIGDGVSDAYDKHGTGCTTGDDTGTGPDGEGKYPLAGVTDCSSNTSVAIRPLGLTNIQLTELEAFLKSLTDPRVQCDKAPFDHPSLHVINGHLNEDRNNDGRADERVFELPAVGAGGYATNSGLCVPNAADLFAPGMQSRAGG